MMSETYYSDNTIQVTDQWIKLRDMAYQISDIKSARLEKVENDPILLLARILIITGVAIALMTLCAYIGTAVPGQDPNMVIIIFAILSINNLAVGLLIREFRKPEYTYVVKLNGRFGKADAIGSKDESYAQKVSEAINKAVRRYRALHKSVR